MNNNLERYLGLLTGDSNDEDRAELHDPASELSKLAEEVRACDRDLDPRPIARKAAASRGKRSHSIGLEELEQGMRAAHASSCTFYVRDPLWAKEFRLYHMLGVRHPEPMHGFMFPDTTKCLLTDGRVELFSTDADQAEWIEENLSIPVGLRDLNLGEDTRLLFERFARREGVKSRARLLHRVDGETEAALFLNFPRRTTFSKSLKDQIRSLMGDMVGFLPAIWRDLGEVNPLPAEQIVRILPPATLLAASGSVLDEVPLADETSLKGCLDTILGACFEAFQLGDETAVGTIHLFEKETGTLRLAASKGKFDRVEDAWAQSVYRGEGVISWVALKRRPLLIEDLDLSAFKRLHLKIKDGVRSELAVPMLAGKEVCGVVNLESVTPAAFSSESVRALCYAADQAAGAYFHHKQLVLNRERAALAESLLDLCHKTAMSRGGTGLPLNELATIARVSLKATICDIWHFNSRIKKFDAAGTTDPRDMSAGPRHDGWSEYIRHNRQSVWITNVNDDTRFDAFHWDAEEGTWRPLPDRGLAPRSINPHLLKRSVQCELGIPILIDGDCIGVAWMKFQNANRIPAVRPMSMPARQGGTVALVLYKGLGMEALIPSSVTMSLVRHFTELAAKAIDPRLYLVG